MACSLRPYREADRERVLAITEAAFPGASLDRLMEERHGLLGETTWADRKRAGVDADLLANPHGVFLAEDDAGRVLGYITTRLNPATRLGWIPNLAVDPAAQGQGLGRALLEAALDYFRAVGMTHAKIETLATNERGQGLYPSLGFVELVRQIHYTLEL